MERISYIQKHLETFQEPWKLPGATEKVLKAEKLKGNQFCQISKNIATAIAILSIVKSSNALSNFSNTLMF